MQALVTGGAGFIGAHLVDRLISKGHTVTVLDDLSAGNKENVNEDARFFEGSVIDTDILEEAVTEVDTIFHLAADISVRESQERPSSTYETNTTGTFNVLDVARLQDIDQVIFSSSAAVYGDASHSEVDEEVVCKPDSVYGASKLAAEAYCRTYQQSYGLDVTILRYFNVYGPLQRFKEAESPVIPLFISKAILGEPLTVYGDGTQTRDFIYVDDIVSATIAAKNQRVASPVNVGTGEQRSVNNIVDWLQENLDRDVTVEHEESISGEIQHSSADIGRAVEELGFKPRYSFDEGMRRTSDWIHREID